MPRGLKRQFSFVYWVGFKDGLIILGVAQAVSFILFKLIF